MAYKYSRGAFTASGSITAEEGLSSLTTLSASSTLQVGGASTLKGVTATTVSGTTSQFTILSASALGGAAVSGLTAQKLPSWDAALGKFEDSYISRTGFGKTIVSGALGLEVTGALGVAGAVSGSSTLQVGSSATIGNGLTVTAGGLTVSAGDSSVQKLTVNGDLIVLGTTISASVQNLIIEDKQIVLADGAANAAAAAGAGFFVSGANVEWTYKQNGEGPATSSGDIFVASGSSGLVDIQASSFYGTFVGTMASPVTLVADAGTLVLGVNYFADVAGASSVTLPAAPSVGETVRVKAPSNCSTTNTITVNRAGSQTIDGENLIVLESPFAAVEFVYVATNLWRIF